MPKIGDTVTFVDAQGNERTAEVRSVTDSTNPNATVALKVAGESGERTSVRHQSTAIPGSTDGSYWY